MEISESQRRETFDRLQQMYTEMATGEQLRELATHHERVAKKWLESAGIANQLSLMIPGQPLAFYFGGLYDGRQENVDPKWIRAGHIQKLTPQVDSYRGCLIEERTAEQVIETYEPAIVLMSRSEVVAALLVRAGFAGNFNTRIMSGNFNAEMAAFIKLIVICLGTSDILQISRVIDYYRKSSATRPSGTTCIIQIAKA